MGYLPNDIKDAIVKASDEVINGKFDNQFIVDIFQTGSGTSSNMNTNEIIANRTVRDILKRFEQKIYIQPRPENGKKCVKIIREFLKIKCPIKKAPDVLSKFFTKNNLNIKISQDYFPIKINKIGKLKIYFNSSEMPEVDIYSGFVFSIRPRSKKIKRSIVGGSYNSLSSSLGLRKINACGAAINL